MKMAREADRLTDNKVMVQELRTEVSWVSSLTTTFCSFFFLLLTSKFPDHSQVGSRHHPSDFPPEHMWAARGTCIPRKYVLERFAARKLPAHTQHKLSCARLVCHKLFATHSAPSTRNDFWAVEQETLSEEPNRSGRKSHNHFVIKEACALGQGTPRICHDNRFTCPWLIPPAVPFCSPPFLQPLSPAPPLLCQQNKCPEIGSRKRFKKSGAP